MSDPNLHVSDTLPPTPLERVVILGSAGAGKSTLGLHLHEALARHGVHNELIEFDDLSWLDDWQSRTTPELRALIEERVTPHDRWIVVGNYSACRDIVWPRATTIIWLDYELPVIMKRLILRTFRRCWTGEELFGTNNVETLSRTLSKDSIIWWSLSTWARRRRDYPLLFERAEHRHLEVKRMANPAQTARWLGEVESHFRSYHDTPVPD